MSIESAERKRSVILLSGGLDSAANLALCKLLDEPVLALTANYGQRAFRSEERAARALCALFGVHQRTVDLRWLGALGGNALTDETREVPEPEPGSLDELISARKCATRVWVPNRNGVLINVAAAYAESLGADRVVVGFNAEEARTFPDNSMEFMSRITGSLGYSTASGVEVHCYTVHMDKTQIVAELDEKVPHFPFESVWSCYREGEEPCRRCESCLRLERALASRPRRHLARSLA